MTKEELKQISLNNRNLAKLKSQYDTLRYKSMAKGQVITGMPHVTGTKDCIGDYVTELAELEEKIATLEHMNKLLIIKARRFFESVPDWVIQTILEMKYINNLYTNEIVSLLGVKEVCKEKDVNHILNTFFLEQLLYM